MDATRLPLRPEQLLQRRIVLDDDFSRECCFFSDEDARHAARKLALDLIGIAKYFLKLVAKFSSHVRIYYSIAADTEPLKGRQSFADPILPSSVRPLRMASVIGISSTETVKVRVPFRTYIRDFQR